MDKNTTGIIFLLALVVLQVIGWLANKNGIITGTIIGIIGLIAGSIFGFSYALKKVK